MNFNRGTFQFWPDACTDHAGSGNCRLGRERRLHERDSILDADRYHYRQDRHQQDSDDDYTTTTNVVDDEDNYSDTLDVNDMFSEGAPAPASRWESADAPRFHAPGFNYDFSERSPFNRPVGSMFVTRPRSAFGDIPIKVSHQRSGSGDASSDNESRASGCSNNSSASAGSNHSSGGDGLLGTTGRAPKVHHIPIHVESRPQQNVNPQQQPYKSQSPPPPPQAQAAPHHQHQQQHHPQTQQDYQQGAGRAQDQLPDVQMRQQDVPWEDAQYRHHHPNHSQPQQPQQQQYAQNQYNRHSSPPKREAFEQPFFRASTPQWREGSPHSHFSTLPQFRERTFSDQMPASKTRPGVRIPVQVERSDSSPVLGDERFAKARSPERGPEPSSGNTGTFPRAKNAEAPLKWIHGLFRGGPRGGSADQADDQTDSSSAQPEPASSTVDYAAHQPAPPKTSPQEKIDKVLADLVALNAKVETFEGSDSKAKEYRFLDEMLTRLMLSLDDVITDGNESLRAARKSAIKEVQRVIDKLERIVQANAEALKCQAGGDHTESRPATTAAASTGASDMSSAGGVTVGRESASPTRSDVPPAAACRDEERNALPSKQRDKSPSKKRQASPSKGDRRSPSPKKDSTAVPVAARRRSESPSKKAANKTGHAEAAAAPSPAQQAGDNTQSNASAVSACEKSGGVTVIVNGVPLQTGQPPTPAPTEHLAAGQIDKNAPAGDSVTTNTTNGDAKTNDNAEPASPEPVTSTATINLLNKK